MTYETNSCWTSMHKAEIEELNRISNNQNYVEMEIARKLRIIRVCREAMEKAIAKFNFKTVIGFMNQVGWTWAYTRNGAAVPEREDFINLFNKEFFERAMFEFIERGKTEFNGSTGGVTFYLGCKDLDYASEDNTFCVIGFDISSWDDDFKD